MQEAHYLSLVCTDWPPVGSRLLASAKPVHEAVDLSPGRLERHRLERHRLSRGAVTTPGLDDPPDEAEKGG